MTPRRVLSLVTSIVMAIGLGVFRPIPVLADPVDPKAEALAKFLGGGDPAGSLQEWSKGLGAIGKLGQALPAVQSSAGGALGFGDLLAKAFTLGAENLSLAHSDDSLNIDQDVPFGDGRTGHLTSVVSNVGDDKHVIVHLTVNRELANQPLSVAVPIGGASNAPQSAFSSTGGVKLTVSADLTFEAVYENSSSKIYLRVVDSGPGITPALKVDAHAQIDTIGNVKASIGILGVGLVNDSSLTLDAHFAGSVSDPNNDAKLYFSNPNGSAGELAQAGSLVGLVNFGFANPAGALNASLHLKAAAASTFAALPAVDGILTVSWPDISTASPTVVFNGPSVGKFLNMTPRDLVVGIAQLVTSLTAIQQSKDHADAAYGNVDLPFLKGSLSDAVKINEQLKKFLSYWTFPAAGDPNFNTVPDENHPGPADDVAKGGEPKFVSVQEFFDNLNSKCSNNATTHICVTDIHYNDGTSKLDFKISLHQGVPANEIDLNTAAAAASGGPGATYTATTVTDNSKDWKTNEFADRRIVAGSSGATIASNTEHVLTLDPNGWAPNPPVAGAVYAISGMQGNVGTVELGDALKSGGKGIGGANSVNATAKVRPSYDASVTLVLDLRNPTVLPEPQEVHNPDGSTTLVTATPTGPDRVLLRTTGGPTLFSADFPISADIDIFANAGFLQVELKGGLKVCQTTAGADCNGSPGAGSHMLTVGLKQINDTDGDNDLTFGQVVDKLLHAPQDLLSFDAKVRAAGSLAVTVPGTTNFLPGGAANASFHWNDVTKFTGTDGPQFNISDLSEFANIDFDPSNPRALFSIILKTLQTLSASLSDANPGNAAIFSEKIPLVGRSMKELLKADESGMGPDVVYGADFVQDNARSEAKNNKFPQSLVGRSVVSGTQVGVVQSVNPDGNKLTMSQPWQTQPAGGTAYVVRSEIDDVISILEVAPSDNMQAMISTVNERLKDSTPIQFEYKELSGTPSLIIHVDWKRAYHTTAPFKFDFDGNTIAGATGSGSFSLGVGGEVNVGLVVPLAAGDGPADAASLKILDNSKISVKLDASVDNATVGVNLGPLALSLGDPTSSDKATAKASYSLDLGTGGTGSATGFAAFIGAVTPTLNASSNAVDCDLPDKANPTGLAMCAKLPLYVSSDGGTTYQKLITAAPAENHPNAFAIRLPKSASASDLFNFSGAQIDGHDRLEAPLPADIAAALGAAALNFTQLDSIDAYLNMIEQALNTASFGGKLPLVGDDLQQGADFVGKIRAAMHNALNALKNEHADGNLGSDTDQIRSALNGYISNAMTAAGLPQDLLTIDTECKSTLEPVGAPTVTPQGAAGTTTYSYKVASYTIDASNNKSEAQPSAAGSTNTGNATLDGTNFNKITWTAVAGAAGYRVFKDEGGTFKLLKDVPGQATAETTDKGEGLTSDVPQNPAQNPRIHKCSATNIDAVLIRLDLHRGSFAGGNFSCPDSAENGHDCVSKTVPLDIGVPGLSLRASNADDGPTVSLGYQLHLAFGLSFTDGFFIAANDQGPDTPELGVGLNFTLNSDLAAQLAFINITAHNCTTSASDAALGCGSATEPTPKDLFQGIFAINLKAPGNADRLKLADLSSASLDDLFDVKLSAEVAIDWLLKAKVGDDAGFPGIQAEFKLHWKWDNADPGANSDAGGSDPLQISFSAIAVDAGAVFGKILGPIVNKIKQVLGPLDPVIKTLYQPIPVLSDLSHMVGGDDVTMISIAKAFSTIAGGPDLTMVERIIAIIDFIQKLPTCAETCLIPLGSFQVPGDKALSTTATPDNTASLIASKVDGDGGTSFGSILGKLESKNGNTNSSNPISGENSKATKSGFSFPVFDNPASLFNILMGGDVDLVKYDSGPLRLAFDWRQQFGPVYAPPPVVITLHGSASVTLHIVAGFDTYGIRKAFEKARNDDTFDFSDVGEAILQSLFFYTNDANGKPVPVVQFNGELAAGAAVTAVIITVGIEGGVGLTVSFLWNDPSHDGKFRISEFLQVALHNPICLFTVSGRLYVFLKLYITIGFSPFSVSFSFTIVDVTLLDFTAAPDCDPPPPKLGGLTADGKTLVVYAGKLAQGNPNNRGHEAYNSDNQEKETVKITSLHSYDDPQNPVFEGVAIDMLGIRREFRNASIERVIVDGRDYEKPMSVTFVGDGKQSAPNSLEPPPPTASFDRDAIVFGGTGNDQIKTGIGNSWVDGGGGDDLIVTGDRTVLAKDKNSYVMPDAWARVAGGPGNDSITVGNGFDVVAGDSHLGSPVPTVSLPLKELVNDGSDGGNPTSGGPTLAVPNWDALPDPVDGTSEGDGGDVVKVGLGLATAYGNGRNDTLAVAADNPLAATDHPHDLFVSSGATLVGGDGSDHVAGGSGPDKIYTAGKTDTGIDSAGPVDANTAGDPAGGPINVVDTGTGTDIVYGGTGQDLVTGHSLLAQPDGTPAQFDDLRGGGGNDILVGGFGEDKIYGGPDNDYVIAEPSTVDQLTPPANNDDGFGPHYEVAHTPLPAGVDPAKKLLVGGLGKDHILGGDGSADVYGDKLTSPCVAGSPVASDPVSETVNDPEDGNDRIIGGAGVENTRAGGGNDYVDARGDNDLTCGEKGDDVLIGGTGDDQTWGGSSADVSYGDVGADKLYGNDGNDITFGDVGDDHVEGNNDSDWVSGGNGDDVILGGTRAAGRADQGDTLSGDNLDDTIIGDNGEIVDGMWRPLDLDGLNASYGGDDVIFGGNGDDIGYGGLSADAIGGGTGNDHAEGNNGTDTIFGEDGEDELIGGGRFLASAGTGFPDGMDTIHGGTANDLIAGDNAIVNGNNEVPVALADSTDTLKGRAFAKGHTITLLDLGYSPNASNSAGDLLSGNENNDVIYGQGGIDAIAGDAGEDYAEGGPAADTIHGNDGEDDLVGGSSTLFSPGVGQPDAGDTILGDEGADVVLGDNGVVLRTGTANPLTNRAGMTTQRAILLYDLGLSPHANSSGDDYVEGNGSVDVIFGQGGNDRLKGNDADDYSEGGQGSDWIEGNDGDDDLAGGNSTPQSVSGVNTVGQPDSADAVFGGRGDDAVIGDNGLLLRVGARTPTFERIGSANGVRVVSRNLNLYDLNAATPLVTPPATQFGADRLSGGAGIDVIYGQDGNDQVSGGPAADYIEGNGGDDILRGDRLLSQPPSTPAAAPTTPLVVTWPGVASAEPYLEGPGPDGQDDIMGGSPIPSFRDSSDNISGDGEGDFLLGDNGVLRRDILGTEPNAAERVFVKRYPAAALPGNAVVIRIGDPSVNPNGTTRFCTTAQATCEQAGTFGNDSMFGDGGDDTMWGQDGDDTTGGGDGDDNMYGELGNDAMFGDGGNDAMVGDRGGVVDLYENGSRAYAVDINQVPKVHYDGFVAGTVTRATDLQHDVNGDLFVGTSTSAKMPHPGDTEGGNDRMRGGYGNDRMHGGFGDDLANGDSGGDAVLGDDGADVIWGGKGCDPAVDTLANNAGCFTSGQFDPSGRGVGDNRVDYLFGGKGAYSGPSVDPVTGANGSDIIDWRPRGTYGPPSASTCVANPWPQTFGNGSKNNPLVTIDPCSWFEMTDLADADATNNQHHQGIDWMYGGWDRDVLQADVADNGPNDGDRSLDWNGAYNLYTHCNSAYGGYNDVRQHSPDWQAFLQKWAFSLGAGQINTDPANGSAGVGTSAFDELALVYPGGDNPHGSGSAYPTTPGHFDDPNACAP